MNTAKATPRPATVTNPPLCANSDGAPLVVALTVPPDVVEEELVLAVDEAFAAPVEEALPLAVELPLVLPVAVALAAASVDLPALVDAPVAEASVAEDFPAFVVDCEAC